MTGPDPVAGRRPPSRWNIANGLTVLRILLVPVFGWLLLTADGADTGMRLAAFAVFAIAALTDKADGTVARKYGLVTDFGKLADPLADKALIGTALIGLSLLGEVAWWITVVIMVRELGITVLRYRVRRTIVISASRGGKLKTVLQVVAIGVLILPLAGLLHVLATILLWVAMIVTVVTGLDYLLRAFRASAAEGGTAGG